MQLLDQQRVDFVQVEAGLNPQNELHVPFRASVAIWRPRGILLSALYEQMPDWLSGRINLRRANPVFISNRLVELPAHGGPEDSQRT